MSESTLIPADEALALLREAVALSPADETAISMVEARRLVAGLRGGGQRSQVETRSRLEGTVQVRVIEAGRLGVYRADGATPSDLASAIRQAMAQARGAEPLSPELRLTPEDASPVEEGPPLFDDEIAALTAEEGQRRVRELAAEREQARLSWSESALTVVTSRGFSRHLRATSAALEVRCGRHPGAGFAAAAARTLELLDAPAVFARARRRDASSDPAEWTAPSAIVLSPEATATLIAAFGAHGLAAAAWAADGCFGHAHREAPALAPGLTLVEDGSHPDCLPFPLDTTGARRRAATLVADGVLRGPVADPIEAAALGVLATRPTLTGEESGPEHLVALPGGVAEDDLLAAAGDGIFVSHLDPFDCWDDAALTARTIARGVHRIERGALAAPLPDVEWRVSLRGALAAVRALGNELVVIPAERGWLGGTGAPAALLGPVGEWEPI